ncbi:MAG: FAD-binding protein [Candidatus Fonsibacter ubiquis]|nr:FAD-binding protein [Candidatus Fonsibacter ubiquis]
MSTLAMPKIDQSVLNDKESIVRDLKKFTNSINIISDPEGITPYETDALSAYKQKPMAVVLPENTAEVSDILKYCHKNNIKVVPRGSGTGLSGGALPLADCVLLGLSKFNKILEIDFENRCVVTQPGVTNLSLTKAVEHNGFYYAPDPSSQIACSIGGNIAENSGGVHSLKYGTTTNNVLGVEIVLMDGTIMRFGGKKLESEGYDLLGLITGSEGLLGVLTEVTVKILKKPQSVKALLLGFQSVEDSGQCVSDIISGGIIPAGMEIMDKPLIKATDNYAKAGYPKDVEAILIVELDGTESEVNILIKRVEEIAKKNKSTYLRISKNDEERLRFWLGRKAAFPAIGDMSPDYLCMDGTIPRKKLAEVLKEITKLSQKHGLRVANCFHAGDGNLHPLIMFDSNIKSELKRAEKFGADILKYCVKVGGVLTGEHGVGIEKRDLMCEMFNDEDIQQQLNIKQAFDEKSLLNPGKVYPILHRCAAVACNLSGSRRFRAGALRDHILGFRGINGKGEIVKSGGTVVKNVTGYDVSKLITGSYGTLVALTEIVLKVQPKNEESQTLLVNNINLKKALNIFSKSMQTSVEISGACFYPAKMSKFFKLNDLDTTTSITAIRLEGPKISVVERINTLKKLFDEYKKTISVLENYQSRIFWKNTTDLQFFNNSKNIVAKIILPPVNTDQFINKFENEELKYVVDWAGNLIWAEIPENDSVLLRQLRTEVTKLAGHMTIIKAPNHMRIKEDFLTTVDENIKVLSLKIKESFDPKKILNPGKMYSGI